MDKENEIMVSIVCLVYNHEKYVAKMLDSLINQKTEFKYEIIIHDDASTDNTANIIRKYEAEYRELVLPIYQTENQYSKMVKIENEIIFPKVRGKYIAFCEGDDFWTDTYRIANQVRIMEENTCVASIGRVNIVNEDGEWTGDFFPRDRELKPGLISGIDFVSYVLDTRTINLQQFQISGLMVNGLVYKSYMNENPSYAKISLVGDFPLFLYIGTKGSVYYVDKIYSCYRTGALGGWNVRNSDINRKIQHYDREIDVVKAYDRYTGYIHKKDVETAIKRREFLKYKTVHNIQEMKKSKNNYRLLSFKEKLSETCLCYFPQSGSFIDKIAGLYRECRIKLLKWKYK